MQQTVTVHHRLHSPAINSSSVWWVPRDSIAQSNVVLNTIVAEAFAEACDVLEKADDFDMAVHDLIKEYATEHQRIVFNGNGYSDEWVAEAEKPRSSEHPLHGRCDPGTQHREGCDTV